MSEALPDFATADPIDYARAVAQRDLARHPEDEAARLRAERVADVEAPPPLPPDERSELDASVRDGRPIVLLSRRGPSYRVRAPELDLVVDFREVRTDRELTADVSVGLDGRHLFRTTCTLSLTARDKLAKTATEFGGSTNAAAVRRAIFAACEAVLTAEENVGAPSDLRFASLALPAGGLHVARPLWPTGSTVLVSPGDAGKSTIARGLGVSLATGLVVIPGIEPIGARPILFVAAEDPVVYWHARSVESICRGLGIDRSSLAEPIELLDARGRPLHRIARSLAERATDFGAIILDSQQALLAQLDASGGIRDRDSLFWHAVDQSDRPTFIIAHPNRADARDWMRADGRIAGSEVNRDRARMAWQGQWQDEQAVVGTSYRRYTLVNVKNNHGPKEPPLGFAAAWEFGHGDDPGTLRFVAAEPIETHRHERGLTGTERQTLDAIEAGHTTPADLGRVLGIDPNTAKARLRRLRARASEEAS